MIKYVPEMTNVVLEEIPDKVTLAVDVSNCTGRCEGCHSPFLRDDVGVELTFDVVERLLKDNFGVNCFLLLGEGNDHNALVSLVREIRRAHPELQLAIYSGREAVEEDIYGLFDYVKVGPYRPSCGPLNNPATNQRLYRVHHLLPYTLEDLTSRFWHRGIDPAVKGNQTAIND